VVREAPAPPAGKEFRETWASIRAALRVRDTWIVGVFIFFFTFSPSFGPALLFYQTDVLGFSQQFIGHLLALAAIGAVVGAVIYAPVSRRMPLRSLINLSIGLSVVGTLAYLVYRDAWSAILIDTVFGCVAMVTQVAFLDLAAKSCPRHVEATFFALFASIYNVGTQASQNVGGRLYDQLGYLPLVLISAAMTAATWLLVPLVKIDRIEARARQAGLPAA
jgi:predicted MFS family arabinose efflux permease